MIRQLNRVVFVNKRRTSISMSSEFWDALGEICTLEQISRNDLLSIIDKHKDKSGLTNTARVFILAYYKNLCQRLPKGIISPSIDNVYNVMNAINSK